MHDWNLAHGATMMDAGLWQRPWYFARRAETVSEAYIREATHVRGEQSEELLDLRMQCLENRRQQLSALVQQLDGPQIRSLCFHTTEPNTQKRLCQ